MGLSNFKDFQLRNISYIRKFLDQKSAETLIHAFVSSKLDFCNSLLFGSSIHQINRLQKIQNTAARIVKKSPRRNHITPILYDLHWLPVKYRIIFKILVITFCGLRFNQFHYIGELINSYEPPRNL